MWVTVTFMAQKPVPNALIQELEPVVAQNMARHLETEELWFAHDYVPFDQGQNFAFLGGRDWDPSEVTLPKHITDALEILLITKDNLAGYHRELVEHFILEEKFGRWLGRWTAEEHLHAHRAARVPGRHSARSTRPPTKTSESST